MWMELEIILLSKGRQPLKDKCHVIFYVNLKRLVSEMRSVDRAAGIGEMVGDWPMGTKLQLEGLVGCCKVR